MNIAIFNHPFSDFYTSIKRVCSNNLNYLKDIIDRNSSIKHKIICFDVVKNFKKEINLPDKLSYLKDYLNNDISNYSFFSDYYRFGDVNNFNHKILKKLNPEIIIISSFAYCYFDGLKKIIEYLKSLYDIPVVCGGHGPSSSPEYYLKNTLADYIVVGPAEITLCSLLDNLSEKKKIEIENIYYRGGKPEINLDKEYFFNTFIGQKKDNIIQVQLTRGCPKKCSYCSIKIIAGNKFRKVDIINFKKDIGALNIKGKVHFDFEDDNLSTDTKYFFDVIKIIKEHYNDSTFSFENGIDFTGLNKTIIDKLISYGIKQWNISLATVNSNILHKKGRGYLLEQFNEIINYLEKFKQPIIVYFISGLINDSMNNIFDTLIYLASKKVIIGISSFYPVPGTEESKNIEKEIVPVLSKASSFYQWSTVTTEEQVTFFVLSRFINSIKKIKMKEWEDIKTKRLRIYSNKILSKGLTRRELSILGILQSFKKEKLIYVNNELNFIAHNLNKKIMVDFFKRIKEGSKIRNNDDYDLDINFFRH